MKLGDFGISKIMTTMLQALTVVGTPYYISPEMVNSYSLIFLIVLIQINAILFTYSVKVSNMIKNQIFGQWVVYCMR